MAGGSKGGVMVAEHNFKAQQIQTVMPTVNEENGIAVTPVQDALSQASNIESSDYLLLKVRGGE